MGEPLMSKTMRTYEQVRKDRPPPTTGGSTFLPQGTKKQICIKRPEPRVVFTRNGYSSYHSLPHYNDLLRHIQQSTTPEFYELMEYERGLNFHFDIDTKTVNDMNNSIETIKQTFEKSFSELLREFYLSTGIDDLKASSHMIVRIYNKNRTQTYVNFTGCVNKKNT